MTFTRIIAISFCVLGFSGSAVGGQSASSLGLVRLSNRTFTSQCGPIGNSSTKQVDLCDSRVVLRTPGDDAKEKGDRGRHVRIGIVGGFIVGGIAGYFLGKDDRLSPGAAKGTATQYDVIELGLVGALIGGILGYSLPHR